jgi:predicted GH43/DUF377 family glycosyl hydrolase
MNRQISICKLTCIIILLNITRVYGQTEWQKYDNNPVMIKDTTIQGVWEWAGIGQPSCFLENDTFKMWYASAGVAYVGDTILRGRISYAFSVDGTTWVKRNPPIPVLDVGLPNTWDSRWCDTPAPLHDGTEYKLYYYGDSLSVVYSALGVATSPDGIVWTRHPGNPVLERGELLDWDGFWVESPAVLYDSSTGIYSMWYTGVGYGPGKPSDLWIQIGYAYSFDGFLWHKDTVNNPVLETGDPGSWDDGWVAVPAVRSTNGLYEMWYCAAAVADWVVDSTLDTARIGYATSQNGIDWVKHTEPVLTNYEPPADSGGPWAPDVLFNGYEYRMWYETSLGISYASAPENAVFEESARDPEYISRIAPNPFVKLTIIDYSMEKREFVEMDIFDITGRHIRSLVKAYQGPGCYSSAWNRRDERGKMVSCGIYLCIFRLSGKMSDIKKVIIVE